MTLNVTSAEHLAIMRLGDEMQRNRESGWLDPFGRYCSRYSEYEEIIRLCAIIGVDTFQELMERQKTEVTHLAVVPMVYQRFGVQTAFPPANIMRKLQEGKAVWFRNVLIDGELRDGFLIAPEPEVRFV